MSGGLEHLDARLATDDALRALDTFAGSIEDAAYAHSGDGKAVVLVLALGFTALTAAVREFGSRADYIIREAVSHG